MYLSAHTTIINITTYKPYYDNFRVEIFFLIFQTISHLARTHPQPYIIHFTAKSHKQQWKAPKGRGLCHFRRRMSHTVEQEIFATGNFHEFRPRAIRMQEIFANLQIVEILSFKMSPCNIHEQEIFANPPIFAKFAKISCTRNLLFYSNWPITEKFTPPGCHTNLVNASFYLACT